MELLLLTTFPRCDPLSLCIFIYVVCLRDPLGLIREHIHNTMFISSTITSSCGLSRPSKYSTSVTSTQLPITTSSDLLHNLPHSPVTSHMSKPVTSHISSPLTSHVSSSLTSHVFSPVTSHFQTFVLYQESYVFPHPSYCITSHKYFHTFHQ